jgi:two-component system, response regulator, stage 0 sporulation protein F
MLQQTQQLPAILIVEDEPDILTILHRLIRALTSDYDIITAGSGTAALEQLALRTVRLVITDYNMPGMNGLQLAAAVKARVPGMPVVLMTAYTTPDLMRRARDRGVDRYLSKPFQVSTIEQVVQDLLV